MNWRRQWRDTRGLAGACKVFLPYVVYMLPFYIAEELANRLADYMPRWAAMILTFSTMFIGMFIWFAYTYDRLESWEDPNWKNGGAGLVVWTFALAVILILTGIVLLCTG